MDYREALFGLSLVSELGMDNLHRLIDKLGAPEEFFKLDRGRLEMLLKEIHITESLRLKLFDVRNGNGISDALAAMRKEKIDFIIAGDNSHPGDDIFPENLKVIKDSPLYLFKKGTLPKKRKSVAMIGSRNCSYYGREIATCFAKIFAECGLTIVSGMARGVDGYAHDGALMGNGITVGVLGFGIDECYPKENFLLKNRILENGALISEYPPGTLGYANHFPARNRLISGFADCLVVVEAAKKSGTLITVDFALEQNKNIYAVPGRIGDPLSEGCNELIKSGCTPLTDPSDILQDFGLVLNEISDDYSNKNKIKLDSKSKIVYANLDLNPRYTEELVEITGLEPSKLLVILYELENSGLIKQVARGAYIRSFS